MKLKLLVLVLCGFNVSLVQAAEDLYPCNLEVKRPATTETDAGSFYARAYVEDRLADAGSPLKFRWMNLVAPKTGAWNSLFASTEEFRYKIQSVQFPQSIQTLGVSYRVGFCYMGPVSTATAVDSTDASQGAYDLVGTISTGTAADYIPYLGNISGRCDLRSVGVNKAARLATEISPAAIDSDMSFSISLGQLSSGEMGFDYPINAQIAQVPRFCKMNVEITEDSTGERPSEINLNEAQFTLQIDKNLR
jgi:hypothetical protein